MMLALIAVLCSTAALAQSAPPPTSVDKQPVRAKSHTAPGKPQSVAVRLQSCLDIDDGTKDRLNCYDAVIAPAPNPKAAAAKTVKECKFTMEEDQRLACFNGFVESMPRLPRS
jgi:hypothetical protein